MGENWFQREFLTPRRLVFNVLFYGVQLFLFGYGWYSQVRVAKYLSLALADTEARKRITNWLRSTASSGLCGPLEVPALYSHSMAE